MNQLAPTSFLARKLYLLNLLDGAARSLGSPSGRRLGVGKSIALASLLGLSSGCRAPAQAQPPAARTASADASTEASVRPGVNDKYLEDGAVARWTETFEHDGREVVDERDAIVEALGIEPGARVVDFGSGTGLFTGALADAVGPEGLVTAVDIIPAFVEAVREENAGRANVQVQLGTPTDPKLPPGSADLVFMSDVYHHIEYPRAVLDSLYEALAPGGQLVIVDFRRIDGVTSPRMIRHVRADQATVRAEVESAGFRHAEDRDWMEENYFMRFERP